MLFALGATVLFATRDNVVRHFAVHSSVPPQIAACMTLIAGGTLMTAYLAAVRGPRGLGRSLRSALVLRRSKLVGRHIWLGAALIVAGGVLIGSFR